jgi:hypothetical protein
VRSKEWVCDLSLAGIAGSNPTAGMGFWELCFPGTGLCDGQIPPPGESYGLYVWVLSVVRCSSNPLHLQWLDRKSQTKKERKKERQWAKSVHSLNQSLEDKVKEVRLPVWRRKFFSSPRRSDSLWSTPRVLFSGSRCFLCCGFKEDDTWCWRLAAPVV